MTALRAALGAATGVGQGLQQREVMAEQRRKDAEEAMFRRIAAGLTPVEDVLPQEQGKVGPLAASPADPPPMSPATLGQAIAQRTQAPAGGAGLMAPPAFGTPAAMETAPERPMSRVERVISDFQGRSPRTVRIGDQRYAMQPTQQENMALNIALQQAAQQDTTAATDARLNEQAKLLAALPQFGGDINKARLALGGVDAGMLGIETLSPTQLASLKANIRQSDAAAAESRARVDAAQMLKSGDMTEKDIKEQIARYMQQDVILKDEFGVETRRPKTAEEVRAFAAALRSILSTPTDFPSLDEWSKSPMNPFRSGTANPFQSSAMGPLKNQAPKK
jgi:hypothetical protein